MEKDLRNGSCRCGSGHKYWRCCLPKVRAAQAVVEELTLEGLRELRKKLNELIIDREIALAVAKAAENGES